MARIDIRNFNGEMPRVNEELLPDNYATQARNVDTRSGTLKPHKLPFDTGETLSAGTETIYLFNRDSGGFWFEFAGDVDIVKAPILRDVDLRTYYTGDGKPKFTTSTLAQASAPYPTQSYDLGLPVPDNFTVTAPDIATKPDEAIEVNVTYVVTFISQFDEESAPSDATTDVVRWDGATVELANLPIPTGNFVASVKRIYRSELGESFQFVADIPAASTTYSDSINTEKLGNVIQSTTWLPPSETLTNLIDIGNGVLMGFDGFTVAFSEPYRPHAWPPEYELTLEYKPVAAIETSNGVAIATEGKPYMLFGDSPENMSQVDIDNIHPCVAKRSMVDMGEYALYASPDGLVAIGGQESRLISEAAILPEQWRALEPETIHAYRFDDRYLAFYSGGAFTFHRDEGFIFFDINAEAGYLDQLTGDIYLKQGTSLSTWNEGTLSTIFWHSKTWRTPKDQFLRALKVNADQYPVTATMYQDGVQVKQKVIDSNKAVSIPALKPYESFSLSLSGGVEVIRVQIASTRTEIQ